MLQLITKNEIRQTRDIKHILFNWIDELAGELEAIEATSWAELACIGEYYEAENFKLICID